MNPSEEVRIGRVDCDLVVAVRHATGARLLPTFEELAAEAGDEPAFPTWSVQPPVTVTFTLEYVNQPFWAFMFGLPLRTLFPKGRAMRRAYRAKTRRRHRRRR